MVCSWIWLGKDYGSQGLFQVASGVYTEWGQAVPVKGSGEARPGPALEVVLQR
jgi:hypothetical protein